MKGSRTPLQQRIGSVIRRHRKAKNWIQDDFADHIGMHRAQYGFIEQGRRDLRLSTLNRVATGLDEPLWVILREAEDDQ